MGTTKKDTATRGGHNPRGVYVFQYVPFPLLREQSAGQNAKRQKIYGAQKLVKHCISSYCSLEIRLLRTQETTRTNKNSQQVQKRRKKTISTWECVQTCFVAWFFADAVLRIALTIVQLYSIHARVKKPSCLYNLLVIV